MAYGYTSDPDVTFMHRFNRTLAGSLEGLEADRFDPWTERTYRELAACIFEIERAGAMTRLANLKPAIRSLSTRLGTMDDRTSSLRAAPSHGRRGIKHERGKLRLKVLARDA